MPDSPTYTATLTTEAHDPDLVETIYRFRHRLFIEKLRWDLQPIDGLERDEFDRSQTVHAALFASGTLVASFRANCTTQPYLCQAVFPALASFRPYPKHSDVWEISRFGVEVEGDLRLRFQVASLNYALMFAFARSRRLRALVAAADLPYERFLTRLGVTTRRYGPPQKVCADADGRPFEMVAGEIPIAAQAGPKFDSLIKLLNIVEITDDTSVLGSEAVSA